MPLVQRVSQINPLLNVWICVRVVGGICVKKAKVIRFANNAQIGANLEIKNWTEVSAIIVHELNDMVYLFF